MPGGDPTWYSGVYAALFKTLCLAATRAGLTPARTHDIAMSLLIDIPLH
jgi:hypothetical protein